MNRQEKKRDEVRKSVSLVALGFCWVLEMDRNEDGKMGNAGRVWDQ